MSDIENLVKSVEGLQLIVGKKDAEIESLKCSKEFITNERDELRSKIKDLMAEMAELREK